MQPPLLTAKYTATARRRSRLVRVLIRAWLAVHAFVLAAAPTADALTERSGAIVAHWDDAQERDCPPLHDAAVCQFCKVVSATFGGTAVQALVPVRLVSVATLPPRDRNVVVLAAALCASPEPRGPPLV